jgi:hypothetical protein
MCINDCLLLMHNPQNDQSLVVDRILKSYLVPIIRYICSLYVGVRWCEMCVVFFMCVRVLCVCDF